MSSVYFLQTGCWIALTRSFRVKNKILDQIYENQKCLDIKVILFFKKDCLKRTCIKLYVSMHMAALYVDIHCTAHVDIFVVNVDVVLLIVDVWCWYRVYLWSLTPSGTLATTPSNSFVIHTCNNLCLSGCFIMHSNLKRTIYIPFILFSGKLFFFLRLSGWWSLVYIDRIYGICQTKIYIQTS